MEYFDKLLKLYGTCKEKHSDAVVLFRGNGFYHAIKEDAVAVSKVTAITLNRQEYANEKIFTCSFPFQKLDEFLPKIIRSGYRVCLCDS